MVGATYEPSREPAAVAALATSDFDAFFAQHHDRMLRALALALGDDELGRDATAEGLTRALERWRAVSRYENPAGWVYRVGLNWGRSRLRKTGREIGDVDARTAALDDHASTASDPAVEAAIRQLSVEHRAVVVARFYLDWSEQEIAEALDVPPGTVKSRLHRALGRLAALMTGTDARDSRNGG
jgi:RNA polymerase sigma-70 factor (ECF subfamily)